MLQLVISFQQSVAIPMLDTRISTNSPTLLPSSLKVDRTAFAVASLFDPSDEKSYWLSCTPQERLRQIEILRRINYGHHATARLQRVLEFTE